MKYPIHHPNPVTGDRLNEMRETINTNNKLLSSLNDFVEGAKRSLVVAKKKASPELIERIEAEIRLYQPSIRNLRKTNGELMSLIEEAGKWEGYEMSGDEYEGLVFLVKDEKEGSPEEIAENAAQESGEETGTAHLEWGATTEGTHETVLLENNLTPNEE